MKMKNIEIINVIKAVNDFVGKDKEIPVKVSYAITKNVKSLMQEIEAYEKEREKIVAACEEAMAELEDEQKKKKCEDERNCKIKELLEIEVEVNIHKIPFEVLENCSNLTTKDLLALDFMIEN